MCVSCKYTHTHVLKKGLYSVRTFTLRKYFKISKHFKEKNWFKTLNYSTKLCRKMCFFVNIGKECHGCFTKGQEIQPGAQTHSVPLPQPLSHQPVPPSLPRGRDNRAVPSCPHFASHDCAPPVFLIISMLSRLNLGL